MTSLHAGKLSFATAAAAASRARRWSRVIRLTSSMALSLSLRRRCSEQHTADGGAQRGIHVCSIELDLQGLALRDDFT